MADMFVNCFEINTSKKSVYNIIYSVINKRMIWQFFRTLFKNSLILLLKIFSKIRVFFQNAEKRLESLPVLVIHITLKPSLIHFYNRII